LQRPINRVDAGCACLGLAQQIADQGVAAFLHGFYQSLCQSGAADEPLA
jgi:hypothetical protein